MIPFALLMLLAGEAVQAGVQSTPAVGRSAATVGPQTLDEVDALIADGRYDEALARADVTERAAEAAGRPALRIRVELVRGAVWQARGFARPAIEHFQQALLLAEQSGSREQVADVYGALASAHGDLGQWDRVLDFAERQHAADPRRTPATEFNYQFQRGVAFEEFHDREQARVSLDLALAAARQMKDERRISMALGELAATSLDLDRDTPRALGLYEEALAIARRGRLRDLEATWLLDSGAALREAGDFATARIRFERAIEVERESRTERVTPAARKNLAQVFLQEQQPERARALLAEARRGADEHDLPQLRWEVRIEEAVLDRDAFPEVAAQRFDEALDILEDAQSSVLVEQLRTGALSRALASADPYDLAIDFLLDQGNTSKAFFVAERSRARAFLETLQSAGDEIARALPPEYVEAEASLLADISEGQAALRGARLRAAERRALDAAIRADEDQLATLRLRLATDRPAVAAIRYPELWHAEDLAARVLKANQALIMFFLGAQRSECWIVDPDGLRLVRLPGQAVIEAAAREYLESVRKAGDPQEPALAAAMYRLLLPDFSVSSSVDELIVIPHGILYNMPFEALRDPSGRRLIERFAFDYAPSASSYALLAERGSAVREGSTLLAIGNPETTGRATAATRALPVEQFSLLKPLPFTGTEMRAIAALYGSTARVLEGTGATESALRSTDLSNVSVLHFATHGLIDEEQPERSSLLLTANPPDDGVLQMREVYGLGFNRALVTLSACDTALGQNVPGEGIVGLSRAFFYAGADAVVASLWSVSDQSTARLMTDFHRALGQGLTASTALRQAKLGLLQETGEWQAPYYWAAFVVSGNGGWNGAPVPQRSRHLTMVLTLSAVGLAAGGLIIWVRGRSRTRGSRL